ncbi:MAG TPA: SRPBCC domain-containing protein, partial [Arthrobacter sp.]|nr:SRPBCC domain-containing protein [Arthrobacter sp.]
GPPTWPATFDKHEFTPGGKASYYMTGPDGERAGGWWKFTAIEAPNKLSFEDGFADDDGEPVADMGITYATVTLESVDGRTRMTTESRFESADQLQKMLEMGMVEGMQGAMGQIDAILAETATV